MSKNVVYLKTINELWIDLSINLEKKNDWIPKMWVTSKTDYLFENTSKFTNSIIYKHEDALLGVLPGKVEITTSLDGEVIDKIARYSIPFFEMMNRWCVQPQKIAYEDKRSYFQLMVRLWINIIKNIDIDIVVCPTIPHRIYDYAAYIACQVLKKPFIMIEQTSELGFNDNLLKGRYFAFTDLNNRSSIFNKDEANSKSSEKFSNYIDIARGEYINAIPSYIVKKNNKGLFKHKTSDLLIDYIPVYIRYLFSLSRAKLNNKDIVNKKLYFQSSKSSNSSYTPVFCTSYQTIKHNVSSSRRMRRAKKYYESISTTEISGEYIFFAASKQPERTTCPDAGVYQYPELIIKVLRSSIPKNINIVYKEHPSNFGKQNLFEGNRSIEYYKKLKNIDPNLIFASTKIDSFSLVDNSNLVATSTGSVGWEAVMRKKPVFVFGDCWYRSFKGVYYILSVDNCRKCYDLIEKEHVNHNTDEIRHFLSNVKEATCDLSLRRDLKNLMNMKIYEYEKYMEFIGKYSNEYVKEFREYSK